MAGLSYLQAFVDSNKRRGRILANGPLLARSKPPMSFIGIDRSNYLSGLVAFYEISDTSLLANAIASAYEQTAPSYAAAVAVQRLPRSVELRERQRIEQEVRSLVAGNVTAGDAEPSIRQRFSNLQPEDQALLVNSITEILAHITQENAATWDVGEDGAERYSQGQCADQPGLGETPKEDNGG